MNGRRSRRGRCLREPRPSFVMQRFDQTETSDGPCGRYPNRTPIPADNANASMSIFALNTNGTFIRCARYRSSPLFDLTISEVDRPLCKGAVLDFMRHKDNGFSVLPVQSGQQFHDLF